MMFQLLKGHLIQNLIIYFRFYFTLFAFKLIQTLFDCKISADGGSRSWVCARWTLCSAPREHQRTFFAALVCKFTNPQEVKTKVSEPLDIFAKYAPLPAQKSHSAGGRGGPRIFLVRWNPYISVT